MQEPTVTGFEMYRKTIRRVQCLAEMDRPMPWAELCAVIEPFCLRVACQSWTPVDTRGRGCRSSASSHPFG
jgi:hypothetical protein